MMKEFSSAILLFAALVVAFSFSTVPAQSSGGDFAVTQSVVAAGGGQSSTGGAFALDGTIGQSAAGENLSGGAFALDSGFWNANSLAPTAAAVSIGGRVTAGDNGLRNARVTLTGANGASRTAITGAFGYYRFDDVAAGETYIVEVASKRYQFAPQVVSVSENLTDLNFTALPQ